MEKCAWCDKEIPEDSEVFGFGGKLREGVDLKKKEGTIAPLTLQTEDKEIPMIITTGDSKAKKEGYDVLFMICSRECGEALRTSLKNEINIFEKILEID